MRKRIMKPSGIVHIFAALHAAVTIACLEAGISDVHSKMIFLICYLLDYQQVHDNANVSIILLGDKKEPTK